MAKLKVGDRFRVRTDLIGGNIYGGLLFNHNMRVYRGQVFEVSKINHGKYGVEGLVWAFNDYMIEPVIENQSIHITTDGIKVTTAILKQGNQVVKRAHARCNDTDVFDFIVGAKLALIRLSEESKKVVKQETYAVGDKVKLVSVRPSGWNQSGEMDKFLGREVVIKHITGPFFKFYDCENWNFILDDIEGKVIDGFRNNGKVEEVKRPANVGEWIRTITDSCFGHYKKGDIYKVSYISDTCRYADFESDKKYQGSSIVGKVFIPNWSYVVLENYQEKNYTQSEVDELIKAERNRIYEEVVRVFKGVGINGSKI